MTTTEDERTPDRQGAWQRLWKELASDEERPCLTKSTVDSLTTWLDSVLEQQWVPEQATFRTISNKKSQRVVGLRRRWLFPDTTTAESNHTDRALELQLVVGPRWWEVANDEAQLLRNSRGVQEIGERRFQLSEPEGKRIDGIGDGPDDRSVWVYLAWRLPPTPKKRVKAAELVPTELEIAKLFEGQPVVRLNGDAQSGNASLLMIAPQALRLPDAADGLPSFVEALTTAVRNVEEVLQSFVSEPARVARLIGLVEAASRSAPPQDEVAPALADDTSDVEDPESSPKVPFHQLLRTLDDGGLNFPAETVANVLLAMQAKGFVILTGISGTGKTRIAQAIAARFPLTREVTVPQDVDKEAAVVTVSADAAKRGRIVLPASLGRRMPAVIDQQGPSSIRVRWDGGEAEVPTYKRRADRASGLVVAFSGPVAEWFGATFSEGSKLVVGLDGPPDGFPDTLTLTTPRSEKIVNVHHANTEIIPVRPDWTDSRGLLGFYNPLTGSYVTTPFLRLLLAAEDEAKRAAAENRVPHPFFVLLDEMNLARVEHYFSDLLSAMESVADSDDESAGTLHLHDEENLENMAESEAEGEEVIVPRRLRIPPNLFIVGTVNVDESTYMFSPKVLDRAFTIEFNAVDLRSLGDLGKRTESGGELDLVRWDGQLAPPRPSGQASGRPSGREEWRWLMKYRDGWFSDRTIALHNLLASENRHFGYRVACEIARFVRLAVEQAADDDASAEAAAKAALDLAVLQKVLVKLAGTQAEITKLIDDLLSFMLLGHHKDDTEREIARWRLDPATGRIVPTDEGSQELPVFPRSAAKLWRMRARLLERGFTSWIE